MDKVDLAIEEFRKANGRVANVSFKELMRKHAHTDPLEAAPRLRNRRQESKK